MINDALRRAKAAQDKAQPPEDSKPQFRPVDPAAPMHTRSILPYFIGAVILVATIAFSAIVLTRAQQRRTQIDGAAGKVVAVDGALPVQARAASPAEDGQKIADDAALKPKTEAAKGTAGEASDETAATNAVAVVAPLKPPEPRLQAIFYSPKRPSAMIDGKTYLVGDKLREFKITAIDTQSATLVSAARTNVLVLP